MSSPSPQSALSPTAVIYTEKLWPNFWSWVITLFLAGASILIFLPISVFTGVVAFFVVLIILVIGLITSTPTIAVTAETLQVGRAHIERKFVGRVIVYRGDAATEQRGIKLNGLAFLCIRGWIKPVVKIEITDPDDKTPYWLTSSRTPENFAAALHGSASTAGGL